VLAFSWLLMGVVNGSRAGGFIGCAWVNILGVDGIEKLSR